MVTQQRSRDDVTRTIEERASITQRAGRLPIWGGYGESEDATRSPNAVRTSPAIGSMYRSLVLHQMPELIVEFGTAFGVSGMYWLAGLESNHKGRLLTFDPNAEWQRLALENLKTIGDRFEMIHGTFEDNIDRLLEPGQTIDLSFIDAIHKSEFVHPQFDIVAERSRSSSLVVLDDVDFSDDMRQCWRELAFDDRVRASARINRRVGIVELA